MMYRKDFKSCINRGDDKEITCLYLAISQSDEPMIRLLVNKGADLNALYGPHSSALFAAISWKCLGTTRLLLDCGANINPKIKPLDKYGEGSILDSAMAYHNENEDIIKLPLERGAFERGAEEAETHYSGSM
jgi:hypothetical protein